MGFWVSELANPHMQLRWFLRSMEWHQNKFYTMNEVVFGVVFIANRVFLGSYFAYLILFVADSYREVKLAVIAVHFFNFFFASQIIGLARRRLREMGGGKIEGGGEESTASDTKVE